MAEPGGDSDSADGRAREETNFYLGLLAATEPVDLPTAFSRPPTLGTVARSTPPVPLGRETSEAEFAEQLAAFAVVVGRYARQDSFALGVSLESAWHKPRPTAEGTRPVRVDLRSGETFASLCDRVSDGVTAVHRFQFLGLPAIVDAVLVSVDTDRRAMAFGPGDRIAIAVRK